MALFGGLDGQILYLQHHVLGGGGAFFHGQIHLAAYHHLGHFFRRGVLYLYGSDIFSTAQDRAPVGNRLDFVKLMRDKEDGFPLLHQIPHDLHQFVDFLRR